MTPRGNDQRTSWLPWVAAMVAALYVAGAVVGWVTNANDGYYGITRVATVAPVASVAGGSGWLAVVEVSQGGPAERAGLRVGDVIVGVDGEPAGEGRGPRSGRIPATAAPSFRLRLLAVPTGDSPAFRRLTSDRAPGEERTLRVHRAGSVAAQAALRGSVGSTAGAGGGAGGGAGSGV